MTDDEVVELLALTGHDPGAWVYVLERRGLSVGQVREAVEALETAFTVEGLHLSDGRILARPDDGITGRPIGRVNEGTAQ